MAYRLARLRRIARPLAAACAIGLVVAGIGNVDAANVGVAAVNFQFQPASRSVEVGDTVRWTFSGDPHTVTSGTPGSPDGRFDSGIKDPAATFQVKFETAGTFRYFCQIHPEQMTGTIVVTTGPAATPQPTPRPTATATPKPSPKPTATATARPTARPTATATARPTATATATARPTATPTAEAPATPSPAATPTETASAPATSSPTSTASNSAPSPSPGTTPGSGQPTSDSDPLPIVVGAVILGVLVAAALGLARRSRGVT